MAIAKSNQKITAKQGNILINVVLSSGAMPTPSSSNTYDLGHVAQSTVAQTTTKTTYKSEDGEVQLSDYEYERVTTATLMQSDKDLIDYLADTVKGATVLQIKYNGVVNGADQWIYMVGQVTPQFNITRPDGANSMQYEFTAQDITATTGFEISAANNLAIASTLGLSTTNFFPTTTVTITAAKSYAIVEVA